MAKNTITLALNGEVTIAHFAGALSALQKLVQALSEDAGLAGQIAWYVYDLQAGSATTTLRAQSDVLEQAERIVEAYAAVGIALQTGSYSAFSEPVIRAAKTITKIIDDKVTSVRFETADVDTTILKYPNKVIATALTKSYGAIEGKVQTLTNRAGLRFNLYDTLHDHAVACYVEEGKEALLREIWGQTAVVEGEISRDRFSGRPVAVRHITTIRVLPEAGRGSYLDARGAAPLLPGGPKPEDIIRHLRDA